MFRWRPRARTPAIPKYNTIIPTAWNRRRRATMCRTPPLGTVDGNHRMPPAVLPENGEPINCRRWKPISGE